MFCLECVHCALTHAVRDNGVLDINLWLVFFSDSWWVEGSPEGNQAVQTTNDDWLWH